MIEAEKEKKAKADKKPKQEVKKKPEAAAAEKGDSKVLQLVRISGVVVDGNLDIVRALMKIKGIGPRVATTMVPLLGYDRKIQIGSLDEQQVEKLEKQISDINSTLPGWMLNRRKDKALGKDFHLTGTDLDISKREDVNLEKKIKSYRGIRHSLNLPVRGQRTKSSFRTGSTIGVSRKKALAKKQTP